MDLIVCFLSVATVSWEIIWARRLPAAKMSTRSSLYTFNVPNLSGESGMQLACKFHTLLNLLFSQSVTDFITGALRTFAWTDRDGISLKDIQ